MPQPQSVAEIHSGQAFILATSVIDSTTASRFDSGVGGVKLTTFATKLGRY